MGLFGKDMAKNFVFVFTFSNLEPLLALDLVKGQFGKSWDEISEPRYISVNNDGIFVRDNQ